MRDWLALIIIILIVGILLDGIRRMRAARKQEIKISKNAVKADQSDETEDYSSSEFPNGKARIAKQRDPRSAQELNKSVRETFQAGKVTVGAPHRIPEQVALNLEESVPMLMDSVELKEGDKEEEQIDHQEPVIGDIDDMLEDEPETVEPVAPISETPDDLGELDEMEEDEHIDYVEPDEVLIVNVMAHSGQKFAGDQLLQVLIDLKLKLGAMEIFHRHLDNDGDGPVLFSLANMVVPGTFNLAEMNRFETPGISLFLGLPVSGDSLSAYEDMIMTAKTIAETLDGELKDENRSVMTSQTIEHGRQRVIEYERKKKLGTA